MFIIPVSETNDLEATFQESNVAMDISHLQIIFPFIIITGDFVNCHVRLSDASGLDGC